MKMSFANVKASFDPMPVGVYDLLLEKVSQEVSANKNPMFVWEFKVVNNDEFKNRTLKYWTLLNDNPFALKGLLMGAGYTEEELDSPDFEFDEQALVGKNFQAKIIQNPYTVTNDEGVKEDRIGNKIQRFVAGKSKVAGKKLAGPRIS